MPSKLIVAYKTMTVPGFVADVSHLSPPANYKDEAKIQQWFVDKKAELEANAKDCPYTGTFSEVQIADLKTGAVGTWKYRDPAVDAKKLPACVAIRAWLLKAFPDAWPNSTHPQRGVPQAIFVGFDPKLFLKMLGTECSLPRSQPKGSDGLPDPRKPSYLPLSMWYANSDHRDVEEAVMPKDYDKFLSWPQVLKDRELADKYKDWKYPHSDVSADLALCTDLAGQLGMLSDE